jgi:Methyltransferase domain
MLKRVSADLLFSCGSALFEAGHPNLALWHLARAAHLASSNPDYFLAAAVVAHRLGDRDRAARWCEQALQIDPERVVVHDLLAEMFLHGEHYYHLIARVHAHLRPRTYLEIGVDTGGTLRLIQPGTLALGVDPQPTITAELPAGARVYSETSDAFFANRDVLSELGGIPVDLAFIDGMHHFEYALRDFMHIERLCDRGSTILVHDCFPHDRLTAQRTRETSFWSGDIWRLIVLLKKYRRDLSLHTIATPPTGLAVIRNLDPSSKFINDNLEALCAEFMALDYSFLAEDRAGELNLFPNDWERIRVLLDSPPA